MTARKEFSIDPDLPIPSIPSPFTTAEGQEKWASILAPKAEEIVDPKAKKPPQKDTKSKDKKGNSGY